MPRSGGTSLLNRYAVVAFPDTPSLKAIEALRRRFDPHARLLDAHITLVFPFADPVAERILQPHVARIVANMPAFDIELANVTIEHDGYLFLSVGTGSDRIVALHDALYTGPLAPHLSLSPEHRYRPHITLGRLTDPSVLARAAAEARASLTLPVWARITALVIVRIDALGAVHVEATVLLSSQ